MKTIVLKEPGRFEFQDVPKVSSVKGHVIVKIKRIGICGTDFHAYKGDQPFFSYPRVLGHELGGEIVDVHGEVGEHDLAIGDKVSVEPYLNCGKCQACREGHINACENIEVIGVHSDGGMAEYVSVPVSKVHKSKSMSFDQLALVETLGIGMHAVKRAGVTKGQKVLIIGAGPIGLSVAQFCMRYGAEVCIADFAENRLAFAKKENFSHYNLLVEKKIIPEDLRAVFKGDLPLVVIDATGNKNSMNNTFQLPAHGGKIVFVGLFQGEVSFFDPNFHKRELSLLASRNCLPEDFKEIIDLIEKGVVDTTPWLSHRVAFDELPGRFDNLLKPETQVIKAIIEL